ncbi:MAG: FtsQ-type POTRA domain-containing protein [Lachnospiraceae bacterium]|nr:FtsQ-type POTRA domain-containing protein [Lachnospiraceae bacterium]
MYRRKKSFIIKLFIFLMLMLLSAGVVYYLLEAYRVENVYVEGNVHYTQEEIEGFVMSGRLGDNSLYLSLKYKNKDITDIPFVDVMNVDILSPDTIKITVYEKALAGYVAYMDSYMYFDKDGYVVECSDVKTVGVPQITGLSFEQVVLGEQLITDDTEIFNRILNITKLLNKYEIVSDKIYFHSNGELTIYFGSVKVNLGDDDKTLEDKIMLLPVFIPDLEGKSGTLQMENYDENGGKYTFKPD